MNLNLKEVGERLKDALPGQTVKGITSTDSSVNLLLTNGQVVTICDESTNPDMLAPLDFSAIADSMRESLVGQTIVRVSAVEKGLSLTLGNHLTWGLVAGNDKDASMNEVMQ